MTVIRRLPRVVAVTALLLAAGVTPTAAAAGSTTWGSSTSAVSVTPALATGNSFSFSRPQAVSDDGRYVVFASGASDLVPHDTNNNIDVFLRDRLSGKTRRVSVGMSGQQADNASGDPVISADGRFVAFSSYASNLVAGDTNGSEDVFVRDLGSGVTRLVSVGRHGRSANNDSFTPWISAHGEIVAFTSRASNPVAGGSAVEAVYIRDLIGHVTREVSRGMGGATPNGSSFAPVVSANGRYVAFVSTASNLVPGDTNGVADVFVRDLLTNRTQRVSVGMAGAHADGDSADPALSAGGRFVVFSSYADNLVVGDVNGVQDVFVRDLATGTTRLVSVGSDGQPGDGASFEPSISADGRYVAFASDSDDLVPGDVNAATDVFVRDLLAGVTRLASVGPRDVQGNGFSFLPSLSGDGRHLVFTSDATNLVAGDGNGTNDVFARDRAG